MIVIEHMLGLPIEQLPEGRYLATSDDLQVLIAQDRTIQETLEIARDAARRPIGAHPRPWTPHPGRG